MKINLIDLQAQYLTIKEEIDTAISNIINTSSFIGGDTLKEFEQNFASYCNKPYCIGVSSGSTALSTVLKQLGIKQNDEVIVPAMTFIATAAAIRMCNATPVFVDVKENGLIDERKIEEKITNKTKAIIPVHLYGNACEMDKIIEIAKKHNLTIVEDCAQAHGSTYDGKKVPITDIGCFSFFPAKNLGAYGDAGAIVCSNEELANKCRKYINHGRAEKYLHDTEGFNFRMDTLQAAILNVKLKHLDNWIEKKRTIADKYNNAFNNSKFKTLPTQKEVAHSYHIYALRVQERDKLQKILKEKGIETGVHYPISLHLQPAFSYLGHKEGDFPESEKFAKEVLSLPMYAELTDEQIDEVISCLNNLCQGT